MAFGDFVFPQVQHDLGLTVAEADLFGAVPAVAARPEFAAQLDLGAGVALAINTEMARTESSSPRCYWNSGGWSATGSACSPGSPWTETPPGG